VKISVWKGIFLYKKGLCILSSPLTIYYSFRENFYLVFVTVVILIYLFIVCFILALVIRLY